MEQQPAAARYLGNIYLEQDSRNVDKAVEAYRAAAEAGDLPSYTLLADIYMNGSNVEQDARRALKYYTYAASQGYGPAQYALGLIYANGEEVPRNPAMGHAWLSWAVSQNYEPAMSALSQLKGEMTLSDLDRARREFMNIQQEVLGKLASPFEEERRALQKENEEKPKKRIVRRRR